MEFLCNIFALYILPFGIAAFILFYVMKAAVKSVLDDIRVQKKKDSLKEAANEGFEELNYIKTLDDLRDKGVISGEQYNDIINKLKKHLNADQ